MKDYALVRLRVNPDDSVEISLVLSETAAVDLSTLRAAASCEWIEVVHTSRSLVPLFELRDRLLMVIDEEGKLNDKPVNGVASALYGNPIDPIVGDAVIGWDNPLEDCEPDIYALPLKMASDLADRLALLSGAVVCEVEV